MGVSDHGTSLELRDGKWIPIFLNAVGEDQIRREGYLCLRAASGEIACKACGCYLASSMDINVHFEAHLRELDRYLSSKQEEKVGENASGFYPRPCETCGDPIRRTGKPGRPPTECNRCKYPLASLQQKATQEVLDPNVWG